MPWQFQLRQNIIFLAMSVAIGSSLWFYISKFDTGNHVENIHNKINNKIILPVMSIQKSVWIFPALFSALHPYRPAFSKVTRSIVRMLLLFAIFTPSLVQLTFSGLSPLTVHFIENVEFNGRDWFLSRSLSFGGTWMKQKTYKWIVSLMIFRLLYDFL